MPDEFQAFGVDLREIIGGFRRAAAQRKGTGQTFRTPVETSLALLLTDARRDDLHPETLMGGRRDRRALRFRPSQFELARVNFPFHMNLARIDR